MERRAKGEGSIRAVRNGKGFEGRVWLMMPNGQKKYKYVGGRNKLTVIQKIAELKRKEKANELTEVKAPALSKYLESWCRSGRAWKETTYLVRESNIRRINKVIGGVTLDKISVAHIRSVDKALQDRGLSSSSRKQALAVLRTALTSAYAEGIISSNPFHRWRRDWTPETVERETRVLTKIEKAQLLGLNDEWTPLWQFQIVCGTRIGETLALRWDDIELPTDETEKGFLYINKTIHRRTGKQARKDWIDYGDTWYLDKPKTANSIRRIVLQPYVCQILRDIKVRQDTEKKKNDGAYTGLGFVFTWHGGDPLFIDNAWRNLQTSLKLAKLSISIGVHALRHTFISDQVNNGFSLESVSKMVGHSSVAFTVQRYGHLSPEFESEASFNASRMLEEVMRLAQFQKVVTNGR